MELFFQPELNVGEGVNGQKVIAGGSIPSSEGEIVETLMKTAFSRYLITAGYPNKNKKSPAREAVNVSRAKPARDLIEGLTILSLEAKFVLPPNALTSDLNNDIY